MQNSPIFNIPIEIYSEIFLHYVSANPSSFWTPLVLSAVCANWRHVALHLPPLWANLALRGDKYGETLMDPEDPFYRMVHESAGSPQTRKMLRRGLTKGTAVEEWLNRSGGCLLSVQYYQPVIRWRPPEWGNAFQVAQTGIVREFYKALIPVRGRVVQLTLTDLNDRAWPEAFPAFHLITFPKLETLIIKQNCHLNNALHETLLPNIRHLQATAGPRQWTNMLPLSDVSRCLPSLTSCNLKIAAARSTDLIRLFNYPHLQEATLTLSEWPEWQSSDSSTTKKSNSRVTKLHLKGRLESSSQMLVKLYLPKLQVFSLTEAYETKPRAIRCQLKDLIQNSAPPLHTLIFDHIQLKQKALRETLSALPTLRVLKLHATRISDEFIELLADPSQGLCPDLEVLDVNAQKSPYRYPRVTRSALQSLKDSRGLSLTVLYNGGHIY